MTHPRIALALAPALLAAATALAPIAALAHHGWDWADAEFSTMSATLKSVSMTPPHPSLTVTAEDGQEWTVELGNPGRTERSGFTADSAAEGAEVLILGNRAKDPAERRIKAVRITIDGQAFDFYPERIPADLPPTQ